MRYKNTKRNKKRALLLVLLMVVALFAALEITGRIDLFGANNKEQDDRSVNDVNYNPPTDEEQAAGNVKKDDLTKPEDSGTNQGGLKKSVDVLITDATQYQDEVEVRAFIPNYIENGVCKITITKNGNESVTRESPAYADASSTICTNPTLSRSDFQSAGDWQVVVSFDSPGASGESTPITLVVK